MNRTFISMKAIRHVASAFIAALMLGCALAQQIEVDSYVRNSKDQGEYPKLLQSINEAPTGKERDAMITKAIQECASKIKAERKHLEALDARIHNLQKQRSGSGKSQADRQLGKYKTQLACSHRSLEALFGLKRTLDVLYTKIPEKNPKLVAELSAMPAWGKGVEGRKSVSSIAKEYRKRI